MERTCEHETRPIPWKANVAILLAQLAAIATCFVLAGHTQSAWAMAGIAMAFSVIMNSVYAIVHEAEHAMLFPNSRANEWAGIAMALFFPAPFHLLRQGHIGHHLRNRSDDEAFDLYFEGDNVVWRWMCWIGILTGLYYAMVVASNMVAAIAPFVFDRKHFKIERHVKVDRASAAFLESYNPAYTGWIWAEGCAAILLHAAVIWLLHIPIWRYSILYAAFGFTWSAMQYVHHFGTERHVTRGARNLFIFRPLDAVWLNHNWHRAHHEHPTVPWVHLPAIGEKENGKKRGFLPWFYLKMWGGPKKTTERVQNKYAGRIIH